MLVPIATYAVVSALSMTLALSRQPEGQASLSSWRCGSAGAILFTAAASVLGYARFVTAIPHAKLTFMVLYYLAQYLVAISAWGSLARPLHKTLGSVENFTNGQSFRVDD